MRTMLRITLCLLLSGSAMRAAAHHAFAAEFDVSHPVKVKGTTTKLEWTNPHAVLHIDAKDQSGQMKQWVLEMGSPSALTRAGWTRTLVKEGDQITVDAWLSRTDATKANLKSVKLKDGREYSGGSSILDMRQKTKPVSD